MSKIVWDKVGEKLYETGVEQGVLYKINDSGAYTKGVGWNGLTNVDENPTGAEDNPIYADDGEYLSLRSKEKWAGTISAYTYPDEWSECDGSKEVAPGMMVGQQNRSRFGFAYKTLIGNDTKGEDYGYKIHLIYNCGASVSSKSHATIGETPEAVEFSWDVTSTAVNVKDIPGIKKMSTIEIDSTKFKTEAEKAKLKSLEDALFGTDADPETPGSEGTEPMLPSPEDVYDLLKVTQPN